MRLHPFKAAGETAGRLPESRDVPSPSDRIPRPLLWLLLTVPALPMTWPVLFGEAPWRFAIGPTGEAAAILLLCALALSPLRLLFPRAPLVLWLLRRRRDIGLAAFFYAVLHLVFFVLSIGRLDYILQGLAWASMWTGWLAFALMLVPAAISSDRAMRRLGRMWKRLQRLLHAVAVLVLCHWLLLAATPFEALFWFTLLAALQLARLGLIFYGRRDVRETET